MLSSPFDGLKDMGQCTRTPFLTRLKEEAILELLRSYRVYRQRVPSGVGFAMMSPSAISILLRIPGREGKLLGRQMGKAIRYKP
jgi:hypothetical protein